LVQNKGQGLDREQEKGQEEVEEGKGTEDTAGKRKENIMGGNN